ncbi:MAG: response regulator [Bacteriovoracaceae bacterium]|nr:response regulator [Bacteriovoracaceae bacterium]
MRLLIVDDSENLRKVVKRYVKEWNRPLEIYEAKDGIDAETILQEKFLDGQPINVIVLDWMMPNMSGLEFLKKIRLVNEFNAFPKIIMLTAETYPEQIEAIKKYGITSYILKPFENQDLFTALDKVQREFEQEKFKNTGS